MEELSTRLSDLLASHDISQRELSRATGISASTICRIIGEQQDVTAYTLVKIADYFGCNLTDITDLKKEEMDGRTAERLMAYARALYQLPPEKQKVVTDMIDALSEKG